MATISRIYEQYKPIWIFLAALIIASGFGFKTPAQTFNHLQGQIDTLQQTANDVKILLRLSCLNPQIPELTKQLAGLNCGGVK